MKLSENEVIIELENRVEENEHRILELENTNGKETEK